MKFGDRLKGSIWIDGKNVHLGVFTDEISASKAYQNKLKKIELCQ